jgi:RNA polymerase sigma factor
MSEIVRALSSEELDRSVEIDVLALEAKESDTGMERLIERFKPFLRSSALRFSSNLGDSHQDEMYGTAMMAFYEAVQKYDSSRGHFFPLASQIVKMRLIDYIRKARRQVNTTVSLDDANEADESPQSAALAQLSIRAHADQMASERLIDEIEQLKTELAQWGISMYDLTKRSPKQRRLHAEYEAIVAKMIQSPDIIQTIQLKHYFPIKAIAEITGVSPKKLERARSYLLASLIILTGDYECLTEYVSHR